MIGILFSLKFLHLVDKAIVLKKSIATTYDPTYLHGVIFRSWETNVLVILSLISLNSKLKMQNEINAYRNLVNHFWLFSLFPTLSI